MMTEMEYIKQLEERVERLEKFISKIIIGEGQNISFNDCTLVLEYNHRHEMLNKL